MTTKCSLGAAYSTAHLTLMLKQAYDQAGQARGATISDEGFRPVATGNTVANLLEDNNMQRE